MRDNKGKSKWYLSVPSVIAAILLAGPFALPLLWLSPCFARAHKIIITIMLIAVSAWLAMVSCEIFRMVKDDIAELRNLLAG